MGLGDSYTGSESWGTRGGGSPSAPSSRSNRMIPSTGVIGGPGGLGGFYSNLPEPGSQGSATYTPPASTPMAAGGAPRDGGVPGTGTGPPQRAPVATPVSATPTWDQGYSILDPLFAEMSLVNGQYQYGINMAQRDNGLNQQMLQLKRLGLGIDAQGIGTDRESIYNRRAGTETDSNFLRTQRGLYDQQLANQLAGIDTQQKVNLLDHENQYVGGGAWFAPGQKFRKDTLNTTAEQDREAARLGTTMSQLGMDRSLAGNDTQLREYDLDMNRLDQRLSQNGINLQMLGLNGQQLTLALEKHMSDLGISGMADARRILSEASTGNGEAGDYARQLIKEWLEGGGQGPIGQGSGLYGGMR